MCVPSLLCPRTLKRYGAVGASACSLNVNHCRFTTVDFLMSLLRLFINTELEVINLARDCRTRVTVHAVQLLPQKPYRAHEKYSTLSLDPEQKDNLILSVVVGLVEESCWLFCHTKCIIYRVGIHLKYVWLSTGLKWTTPVSHFVWISTALYPVQPVWIL